LGAEAADAGPDLSKLLDDPAVLVRLAAASALLRIQLENKPAAEALALGLASADADVRRQAARAAGLAGSAAAPLAVRLAELLKDSDPNVRRTALQAIATLGPAAASTLEPVTALLDQRETAIDAADALGRMGLAARPSMKRLARMLSADAAAERWAGVRAMAQIGGADAAPAVQFMIREMPRAAEVDSYNILIYLALLGPVAKDALPAVRTSRVHNPVLRQATAWAIDPEADLPSLGALGDAEFVQYIFESYVRELGHLKPAALSLATKILAGKAGNVPDWGYKLLARYPDDVLAVLTPALADKDRVLRERAAVALGYMGRPAAAAKREAAQALQSAEDEREQHLMQWCLRQME
jgi:HEAT repeat protein